MTQITDSAKLDTARTAIHTTFNGVFGAGELPGVAKALTAELDTNQVTNNVVLLDQVTKWRRWLGPKVHRGDRAYGYTIKIEPWERTHDIKRMDLQYDGAGIVSSGHTNFITDGAQFFDQRIFELYASNPVGYDGVPLISSSHPHSPTGGVQSNKTTAALTEATLAAAFQAQRKIQRENGDYFGLTPMYLAVHSDNREYAQRLLGPQLPVAITNAGAWPGTSNVVGAVPLDNPYAGRVKLLDSPLFNSTSDWFLASPSGVLCPFVALWGRRPALYEQFQMTDQLRMEWDIFTASLECDVGFGAGLWQTIYGRNGAS